MPSRKFFFLGLFLVCLCTLMLQIVQTRILSVVSMYYLAFLSISMAMLGMTAGALLVYFKLDRITAENVAGFLSRLSTAFALTIFFCFALQLASPMPFVRIATLAVMWVKMLFLLAAPFVVGGIIVSLALTRSPFPIGLTYGVDLFGAAFGCLAVLLLLNWVDASSAVLVIAAIAALAGVCFRRSQLPASKPDRIFPDWRILHRPGLVALLLLAMAGANTTTRYGLRPISTKFGEIIVGANYEFARWNSFSRILVSYNSTTAPFLWGQSPTLPEQEPAEQRALNIDGFAGSVMPRFAGDPASVEFLKYDITNLVYHARPNGRVAVIGVGSGRDLLSAHIFGSPDITGVELNPIFVDLLTNPRKLRDYAGIADLPGVRLVVDEGRSWFARTQQSFDVLQMSMIDTFAATGAGAFSLSENGLYTLEGWRVFLSALSPSGLFTVSRWHSATVPAEMGRTMSLAVGALLSLGAKKPSDHIFLATADNLATLIVAREPLTAADLRALTDAAERLKFTVLAAPTQLPTEPVFKDLMSATSVSDLNEKASAYWLDVSPPTDARPFFFNQLRLPTLEQLGKLMAEYRRTQSLERGSSLVVLGNMAAMGTLLLLIFLSLLAVIVTILVPARASISNVAPRIAWLGSAYFLLIGLGFMFIEIGLIQRISIFMGHPVYALGVVLFSVIVATGCGSLLSERLPLSKPAHIIVWLSLLVAYVLALPTWLPVLLSFESADLVSRSIISVACILPAGILMGYGFPTGMKLVMSHDSRLTPWLWGVNGAAGVLAAGTAVACSIIFSVDMTIRVGGICYLLLLPSALLLMRTGLSPRGKLLSAYRLEATKPISA